MTAPSVNDKPGITLLDDRSSIKLAIPQILLRRIALQLRGGNDGIGPRPPPDAPKEDHLKTETHSYRDAIDDGREHE